jgi:hypothetical protein
MFYANLICFKKHYFINYNSLILIKINTLAKLDYQ